MSDTTSEKPEMTAASLRFVAMNYLARREHAAEELRQKLKQRCEDQALIEQVLAKLSEDKLQSDERFAEAFIAMRRRQGKGPVRILQELKQKGVAAELVDTLLDPEGAHWWDLAREVRERRFGPEPPGEAKDKARQVRFLQYRGFTGPQIRALFS